MLTHDDSIDVISSAVFATDEPTTSWQSCHESMSRHTCEVWFTQKGHYSLSSFVQTDPKSSTRLSTTQNLPHNAPVYKRSVHTRYGYFSSDATLSAERGASVAPTCFDWRFWIRAAIHGAIFFHIDYPLEVYYIRADSHGRRDKAASEACTETVLHQLSAYGLYNNAHFWEKIGGHHQHTWRKMIAVINVHGELAPNSALFVRWLRNNGHLVTVHTIQNNSTLGDAGDIHLQKPKYTVMSSSLVSEIIKYDIAFVDLESVSDRVSLSQVRELLKSLQKRRQPTYCLCVTTCDTTTCHEVISFRNSFHLRANIMNLGPSPLSWLTNQGLLRALHA